MRKKYLKEINTSGGENVWHPTPHMIPPNFLETPLALANENCWPSLEILTESTSPQKGQGTERAQHGSATQP